MTFISCKSIFKGLIENENLRVIDLSQNQLGGHKYESDYLTVSILFSI